MMNLRPGTRGLAAAALVLGIACPLAVAQELHYPPTAKVNQVDTYFGTAVADPYRWLENDTSAEVARWVAAQNKVTFDYFDKIPFREKLRERLKALYNYPKYSAPMKRGDLQLFFRNDGLQNQSVLYIQKGTETPEVLLDPNALSGDGTTRIGTINVSHDNKYLGYSLSESGSDWEKIFVIDLATKTRLPDSLAWVKFSGIAWRGDGFYYSRYDAPVSKEAERSSANENQKVFYHRLRTPQSEDRLVYEDPAHPQRFNFAETTEDERFLVLTTDDRGKGMAGNALFVRDLRNKEDGLRPIVTSFDHTFGVVVNIGDRLLVATDSSAPNDKLVLIDPAHPEEARWKVILPERPEPLNSVTCVGGKIFATYLKDVSSRVEVHDLDGRLENTVSLPALGIASGFSGRMQDTSVYYTFTSFTFPQTIYRYDIPSRRATLYRAPEVRFTPGDFETEQVFYRSKDGTRVPMFIVRKKGTPRDGKQPTLLYGYGGFDISLVPNFDPLLIGWLEQGGTYAEPNLRGGGEYGEEWHRAGTKDRKQNVFDDFIAGAEWLIANRYTDATHLGIQGGSNGGLLVGAVMNQRPDLFAVALPAVGVMDMLRFQKFTVGWNWIPDYGSSQDSAGFRYLSAYSPLHNIRQGLNYPATLVTTADHDDRVVPAHSFKYIATLQEKYRGPHPVLIRIETKSGHGSSSVSKRIEERADEYAFLLYNLGMAPAF